jgi:hypothetical protein
MSAFVDKLALKIRGAFTPPLPLGQAREIVRAVLATAMTPDKDMILAGIAGFASQKEPGGDIVNVWQAMLRKALEE